MSLFSEYETKFIVAATLPFNFKIDKKHWILINLKNLKKQKP